MFWDHRPESTVSLEPKAYDSFYLEAGHPDCLFDGNGKHRYVTLTELLSLNSQKDADVLVARLAGSADIAVICVFVVQSRGSVVQMFLRHRVLQAVRLLEDMMPESSVTLMNPPELGMAA
ncbi:hypothetical protein [Bifidobacterium sp. UTBIF-56]|uniref:hypothetical protein n=1 Tax=Bifidobacterium sp. UTBIF-56 TaxID=1465261 RepID=UPI00112A11BF|nr:hypothetical protein [Bifidobacterium sp. UTBIF-56]TPF89058.1 hypothetical protein BW10_07825 [Bifidobacterium sp. UTBIF-56]